MRREQKTIWFDGKAIDTTGVAADMPGWFVAQSTIGSNDQSNRWFLAHTAQGIIWGKVDQGKLHLSCEHFPAVSPPLEAHTLWEARLFWKSAQVHLWRTASGFAAWRIDERPKRQDDPTAYFAFDEWHRLWGTELRGTSPAQPNQTTPTPRFTLLADGQEGLQLALPLLVSESQIKADPTNTRYRPARLLTRSYVGFDAAGCAYVTANRLVELTV